MCPFNALSQILLLILAIILINGVVINALSIKFKNDSVIVHMDETISVPYTILKDQTDIDDGKYTLQLKSNDDNIANINQEIYFNYNDLPLNASLNISGVFLGKTSVSCKDANRNKTITGGMEVIVIRKKRLIDTIFTASVATLVSIIYINFGCFLNWGELKRNLRRPVGPVIGLCSQFLFMPLMCPFNALSQILLLILAIILINGVVINALSIKFKNDSVIVHMDETISVPYTILKDQTDIDDGKYTLQLKSNDDNIANINQEVYFNYKDLPLNASLNISGVFLGKTSVSCKDASRNKTITGGMDVIVIRKKRLIDTIFTASVATLVSIIYINFGCFLNWGELKRNLRRPVGPVIGLCSQFLFMPLLSFGLGRILFPESPEMQLGMFFTGVAPSGGASNIWTLVLDGNVDLSITVTSLGNFVALLMMPLWIFSLGHVIFNQANLGVPYIHVASSAFGLIIPLGIGYLLTRYLKNVASFLARILKGLSSLLLVFIIVFATVTNLYLFKIFSWKIIVAGMALPYAGFLIAYTLSKILRQPSPDCLAISIETGIQNTGIAIFLLRFSLTQPAADLTTVCPVAVSMMTPIPLVGIYIYKKILSRIRTSAPDMTNKEGILKDAEEPENSIYDRPDEIQRH